MSKSVTIKDIAKRLNISTSTVSRALSDKWDVSHETRAKVLEVAKEMNYRPNLISLSLRKNMTFTIGVIIPEFMSSFFAEVINGINSVLISQDYQILICQSGESYETELKNVQFLESRYVDGYLVSVCHDTANKGYYQQLIERGTPVVFFNRTCDGLDAPEVIIDDRKWAYAATEHLIRQGCRRIAHLSGPDNLSVSKKRRQGYEDALRAYDFPVEKDLIIPAGIFMEDGERAADIIASMDSRPDGIFVVNDPCAVGAVKRLKKLGFRIPDDIAVASYTESVLATVIEPNLTSIAQPTFEIGASAARLMLEWLHNGRQPQQKRVILDAQLNIRESSRYQPKK